MPLLTVPANDIDISGVALDVPLPIAWLTAELADAEVAAVAPGKLSARLSLSGNEVVVRGRVKANVTVPCARCLAPTEVAIDTEISLLLRPVPKAGPSGARGGPSHHHARAPGANGGASRKGGQDKEPEYEFSSEEADVDTYDGETVVLDPFVREAILLEMPNFPLCSEACPGIGPAASDEAAEEPAPPVDPRLAPLNALREKLAKGARRAPEQEPPGEAKGQQAPTNPTKKTKKKE